MKLTIARLGHRGDGIAESVYAPGTLPGEEVEGDLAGDTLTGIRILTPSAARVKPPCAHARTLGNAKCACALECIC